MTVVSGLEIDEGDWDVQARAQLFVSPDSGIIGFHQGGLIAVTTPLGPHD